MQTPVAFLIFNRPDTTERVAERIAASGKSRVYVIADGPRALRPDESRLVEETREVARRILEPCMEVIWLLSSVNMGCGKRVSSGLSEAFEREERLIVLEDDCLPDASFFPFCEEVLLRYANNPQVGMISGSRFTKKQTVPGDSYYFSSFVHIWGWASWRRAWRHYDFVLSRWRVSYGEAELRRGFLSRRAARKFGRLLDQVKSGDIDTWDYQFMGACLEHRLLAIHPRENLVQNIGFGPNATHTSNPDDPLAKRLGRPIDFPLCHPSTIEPDRLADRESARIHFPNRSLIGSWVDALLSKL